MNKYLPQKKTKTKKQHTKAAAKVNIVIGSLCLYIHVHVQVCIIKFTLFLLLPTELSRHLDVVSDWPVVTGKCFAGCCCCLP